MSDLRRHTVNLPPEEDRRLADLLAVESPALRILEQLAGESLGSRSAQIRALVQLGVDVLEQESDRMAYDAAVGAGDFDDTSAWIDEARSSRRRGLSV
jgi:hypothetical protein